MSIPGSSGAPLLGPAAAVRLIRQPDQSWDPLLLAVAAYLLTAVGRVHQLFGWLEPLHLPMVVAGSAIALWLADRSRVRRLRATVTLPATRVLLGLALWIALSVPGALWAGGSFDQFVAFVKTLAIYLVMVSAVRGMRDVERLAGAYFVGCALYAAVVLTRFGVGQAAWRLGSLYYYDANDFATFTAISMPIGIYFVFRGGSLLRRLAAGMGLGVMAVTFVWSGSRGGFLALLAVILYFLFRYRALRLRWRVLAVSLLVVGFVAVASDRYWEQMRTIFAPEEDYNRTSETGRMKIWKRGIGYMFQHPVFGVGAANFPFAEGTISPLARRQEVGRGVRWNAAHNSYVQAGAELGVPGLVLFLVVIGAGYRALWRVQGSTAPGATTRDARAPLAQSLTAGFVAFTVGAVFLSLAYSDLLYALVALAAAALKVSRAPPIPLMAAARTRTGTRKGTRW